jgi:hypothetical protein
MFVINISAIIVIAMLVVRGMGKPFQPASRRVVSLLTVLMLRKEC